MSVQSTRKASKAPNVNVKKTLDIQHSTKLTQIQQQEEERTKLKDNLKNINKRFDALTNIKKTSGLSDAEFDEYLRLIDERDDIQKQLDTLEQQFNEVDYLVNTGPILFKYYDILEKGASNDENINNVVVNENSILKFFIKPTESEEAVENKDDRASLLEKYLSMTDENYMIPTANVEHKPQCQHCSSSNMSMMMNDGIIFCNECGSMEYVTVDHDKPSYKDAANVEVHYFAYKRINHLNESGLSTILSVFTIFILELLKVFKQVFKI